MTHDMERNARQARQARNAFEVFAAFAAFAFLVVVARPSGAERRYSGWPAYGGGPEQIRYSSLTHINRSNVGRLEVAWTYDSGESGGLQTNPIVVDGVLFTTTPKHRVVALDAASGAIRWRFDSGIEGRGPNRGVTYWSSEGQARIFTGQGHFLYALDARTGTPIVSFGRDGRIDLRDGSAATHQPSRCN